MFSQYGELCTEVYNLTKPAGYQYNRKPEYAGQMITYEAVKP
ncbi:hypothetical protein [Paenibacillus medicaginis]|uniref:Uncharacterized protein n=1 Tax=Paenibacillus medicaginis TaxID=1470560 RepID=A0ABV5BYB2_9BACL